ncbi:MAG: sulfatase [Prosthecobacter sp.]
MKNLLSILCTLGVLCSLSQAAEPKHPNVVIILFDDLSDWISLLDPSSPIAMPQLERLARRGVSFQRAYCAAPQCNPSRTALITGFRPTTTGVYENASDWKKALPGVVTLPHYFRQHGYFSIGAGKVFHHVHPHFHDEAAFDEYLPFVAEALPQMKLNGLTRARTPEGEWESLAPTFDWGTSPAAEGEMLDTRSATRAAAFLKKSHEKPFFLAVGFFRPHLPYFAPPEFIAKYPLATMPMPPIKANDLDDVATGAEALMHPWRRMFRGIQQAPDAALKWREAIATYAAGASYADAQLGRVLDALDASPHGEKAIIIATSDHGYHLGEKDHWTKFALWEKATRVPLIIAAPGVTKPGSTSQRPVSLIDLYPTLIELCDLPPRADLDGLSLVPLLRDPAAKRERPALITEQRGNHAVRTDRWRYIRYADGSEELYEHENDPHEWTNLAADPSFLEVIANHRRWLPEKEAAAAPRFSTKE